MSACPFASPTHSRVGQTSLLWAVTGPVTHPPLSLQTSPARAGTGLLQAQANPTHSMPSVMAGEGMCGFTGSECFTLWASDAGLENRDEEEQGHALFQAQVSLPIPDFTATESQRKGRTHPHIVLSPPCHHTHSHIHTHTDMQTPARVTIPVPFLASPVPMTSSLG